MIAIVDYGRGNLGSVEKAFARVGMPAVVTQDPAVVDDAEAVVQASNGESQCASSRRETGVAGEPVKPWSRLAADPTRASRCGTPTRRRLGVRR